MTLMQQKKKAPFRNMRPRLVPIIFSTWLAEEKSHSRPIDYAGDIRETFESVGSASADASDDAIRYTPPGPRATHNRQPI
jgi:hypothetical protein